MKQPKPILAVGSIALDDLVTANGSRRNILGGSATYFSLAAALFAPVRLVAVVGKDFPESGWELLKSRNIDVSNVQVRAGRTFRWGGEYSADFSTRQTLFTELGVFENFHPAISETHLRTPFIFLGNIQPTLQIEVADLIPGAQYIICDTMNLWIDNNVNKLWDVLKKVHIFLLNDEEAVQLTGKTDLDKAADKLLSCGPESVIIKRGARGALLATGDERVHIPIYRHVKVVDPTGAGDTFAGGLIGHLAKFGADQLTEAIITAAAVASFTVSGFGLEGLLTADVAAVEARCHSIRKQIQ